MDAPYFDLLFKGCYLDQEGQRWCFRTNSLEVGGAARHASLQLDTTELPPGGSLLEVAGDDRMWLFAPRDTGWAVYRTTWASASDYAEPAWSRPGKCSHQRSKA
jgi:hypothetical protein